MFQKKRELERKINDTKKDDYFTGVVFFIITFYCFRRGENI